MRTLLDLHDRLRAYVGNDISAEKSNAVTRAAAEAVNAISSKADWLFYRTWGRLATSAPYAVGTIEFDLTGGTVERQVILSTGVWPTWAAYGTLVINNVTYDVARRWSDTVISLKANDCPSADVASGTTYNLYRMRYDLPTDFQAIQKPMNSGRNTQIQKVTLEQLLGRKNYNDSVGTPIVFTIIDSGLDRKQILFWYPPDTEYSLEFEYKRKPVFPVVVQESTGKINLIAGSTAVNGLSTNFTASMAGAVLRVSYDQTPPGSFDSNTPPVSEYLIDSWTSASMIDLSVPAEESVTNRAYTISSRVDVSDGPMFNLLAAMGYKRLRIALRINMTNEELKEYETTEKEAMASDGQAYAGTDIAAVSQARVPHWRGVSSRTIPGNG